MKVSDLVMMKIIFYWLNFSSELDSFVNNQSTGDADATAPQQPEEELPVKESETETPVVVDPSPMEIVEPVN